jgi:hypothetical protein
MCFSASAPFPFASTALFRLNRKESDFVALLKAGSNATFESQRGRPVEIFVKMRWWTCWPFSSLTVFFIFCAGRIALAQDPLPPSYTKDYAEERLNESVNTNTLFSSHDLISNGRFLQRRNDQPDTQYDSFRLPVEMQLSDKTDVIRPFVRTGFGLLKVTGGSASIDDSGESDFSVTKVLCLSSGLGAYIDLAEGLSIAPAVNISYSHLGNDYDFNNRFSQEVLRSQYSQFYNWGLDVVTYTPQLRIVYETQISTGSMRYIVSASQLFNDSFHGGSSEVKIHSYSGLVSNRVEYQHDLGVSTKSAALALQPFFQWGNISGKAAKGLNFVNMFEVGADLVFKLKEKLGPLSAMYVGSSYVTADSFEGYHIGLGGKF